LKPCKPGWDEVSEANHLLLLTFRHEALLQTLLECAVETRPSMGKRLSTCHTQLNRSGCHFQESRRRGDTHSTVKVLRSHFQFFAIMFSISRCSRYI